MLLGTISGFAEKGLNEQCTPRDILAVHSRDNSRTPVQRTDGQNGGFTQEKLWIEVNKNCAINAVAQFDYEVILFLPYYRKLVALRKIHDVTCLRRCRSSSKKNIIHRFLAMKEIIKTNSFSL